MRRIPRSRMAVGLALGVVLLAGLVGWRLRQADSAIVARAGTVTRRIVATGRVAPVTEVTLANKIPGRIRAVLVKEGDTVASDQPVVLFDDTEAMAQVRMAEARVGSAEAALVQAQRAVEAATARWREVKSGARAQEIERARADLEQAQQRWRNAELERTRFARLLDNALISRSQYEAAVTEADVARARLRAAEQTLDLLKAGPKPETVAALWAQVQEAQAQQRRAERQVQEAHADLEHARAVRDTNVVRASVNGRVTRKLVEPGEAVAIGTPLMVVADVSKTLVKAEVDETDLGKLALGQPAEVTCDAYPGRVFPGKVVEIGQVVGKRRVQPDDPVKIQDMKVLETKIEILKDAADLKFGMTVDVAITATMGVVVIPAGAVPAGTREAIAQVVGPRGAEERRIRLGAADGPNIEVVSGLRAGERVSAIWRR